MMVDQSKFVADKKADYVYSDGSEWSVCLRRQIRQLLKSLYRVNGCLHEPRLAMQVHLDFSRGQSDLVR